MSSTFSVSIAFGIFAVTTWILYKFHKPDSWWQDWLKTCVSVLASALIAIPIGISVYRSQITTSESSSKKAFTLTIKQQIQKDILYLESDGGIEVNTPKYPKKKIAPILLSSSIFEEAGKSNLFNNDYTQSFLGLSREIQTYNLWINYFMAVASNTFFTDQQINNAAINIDNFRNIIINHEKNILNEMQKDISLE